MRGRLSDFTPMKTLGNLGVHVRASSTATAGCASNAILHSRTMGKKHDLHFSPYGFHHVKRRQEQWGARVSWWHSPVRHDDRVRYMWRDVKDVAQITLSTECPKDEDRNRTISKKPVDMAHALDVQDAGRPGGEALWMKLRTAKDNWDTQCRLRMGKYMTLKLKARVEKNQANMVDNGALASLSVMLKRIEFDLDNVHFDSNTLDRTLYVTGIHAHVDETLMTKLFAPYGLDVSPLQCLYIPESDLMLFSLRTGGRKHGVSLC